MPTGQQLVDNQTNRLIQEGSAKGRYRQCSLGWHFECSDWGHWGEGGCQCPCHEIAGLAIDKASREGRL